MAKKRICLILPNHWTFAMGGAQYQAKLITEALIQQSDSDVHFIANRARPEADTVTGYTLRTIGSRKGIRRFTYLFDTHELLEALEDIRPDVIYQRVTCAYTGIAAWYSQRTECKLAWHIAHEWDVTPFQWSNTKDVLFRWAEKKAIEYGVRRADLIFAQTRHQQTLLSRNYGRSATLIPNFHPNPAEAPDKEKHFTVVWVANLKSWKRPEVFVQLAESLQHRSDIQFVMIGRVMYAEDEFKALNARMVRLQNLSYLGELSQGEVNQWLARSHVFVNTSRYEGFPNTFIQAWMRECVVVSLSVNPDNVFDQEEPRLGFCAQDHAGQLTDMIRQLADQPVLRSRIAENALKYVTENHSIRNVDRVVGHLQALLASSKR